LKTGEPVVAVEQVSPRRGRASSPQQRIERLSLNIEITPDGTVPFRRTSDVFIPAEPGVYIIHDLRGALYVGRSVSLLRRFEEHEDQPSNPLISLAKRAPVGPIMFSWIILHDHKRRQAVEAELVSALDPPCNRCIPNKPIIKIKGE
jgi:predicted GIY-YIG superfamily endonuclease